MKISTNYRRLNPEEVADQAAALDSAWKAPEIPTRQWEMAVRNELARYRFGIPVAPFDVLVRTLRQVPMECPSLLDVGASSGFYSEVFKIAGYGCRYVAMDYSEEYRTLAETLYPDIRFDVGDARALPYPAESFDVVLSGCCLIHIYDYEKVIAESARVAKSWVVMHRTPVLAKSETTFYVKEAYGIGTLEVHVNESELMALFAKYGLALVAAEKVYEDGELSHTTYLLKK